MSTAVAGVQIVFYLKPSSRPSADPLTTPLSDQSLDDLIRIAETGPVDPNPPAKDFKDVRSNEDANGVAQELRYEGAEELKDAIGAGATDIISINKKTGRRMGPATWRRRARRVRRE